MAKLDYNKMYEQIYKTIGNLTPLKADCGVLCGGACCKGDSNTGMRLFPYEHSDMNVVETEYGFKLVVCDGICDRDKRPLACRIFPFFPTIDEKGRIYVELDYRAKLLCPMIDHCEEIIFDKKFLKAVKKVGKILLKDEKCKEFLYQSTDEIDTYHAFLNE